MPMQQARAHHSAEVAEDMESSTEVVSDDESRLFVASLARGLLVFTAFGESRKSMTLQDIANVTGLSKSSAQRFCHTLWRLGYLDKHPSSKTFSLAAKTLDIGLRFLQTNGLIEKANPYVHALTRNCGETCTLSQRDGTDMLYISRFPAHKEMFVNMPLGMRIPMYCTAGGRVVMSRLAEDEVRRILESSQLIAYTSATVTQIDQLLERIQIARRDGFAVTCGEYYKGDITVSAVITDPQGAPIGAVNASVPASRWEMPQVIGQLAPQVVEAARAIGGSVYAREYQP